MRSVWRLRWEGPPTRECTAYTPHVHGVRSHGRRTSAKRKRRTPTNVNAEAMSRGNEQSTPLRKFHSVAQVHIQSVVVARATSGASTRGTLRHSLGSHPSGSHRSLSGDDSTPCLGGRVAADGHRLNIRHETRKGVPGLRRRGCCAGRRGRGCRRRGPATARVVGRVSHAAGRHAASPHAAAPHRHRARHRCGARRRSLWLQQRW